MLQLDRLTTTLGTQKFSFTLQAPADARLAIVGASGSGKSTLLNLIAGFVAPDSGSLNWKGQSLLPLPAEQRPVTTLFQQHNLFAHLDVRQNTGLGLSPGLKLDGAQWRAVENMLDRVGLAAHLHKYPRELSGGEQQRVALARCLLAEREILLMDEPWSALDETNRLEMIALCDAILRESPRCTLFVTHNEDDAMHFGAEIAEVGDGQLQRR